MNGTAGDWPRLLIHFMLACAGSGRIGNRPPVAVDGDEHHFRFGHLDRSRRGRCLAWPRSAAPPLGLDLDPHVTDVRPTRTVSV